MHVTGDDNLLVNLKFVPKGENDEVFGMPIPKELITKAIQQSPYYQQYREMPVKEKASKPSPIKKIQKGKVSIMLKEKRLSWLMMKKFNRLLNLMWMITIYNESNSLGLIPNQVPATNYVPLTNKDLEILFQLMFDDYFELPRANEPVPTATTIYAQAVSMSASIFTTIAQDAPSISMSPSSSNIQASVLHQGVAVGPNVKDNPFVHAVPHPSFNPIIGEPDYA
ncbi:hypothetical protein Tco_0799877 [Tanacetum coccineum]|uniref:Uncharacterized protein n=1 Tax=Tanacetum coccineum TaxID=301880 RepID=A0ABQ4ZRJ6_9ASTR